MKFSLTHYNRFLCQSLYVYACILDQLLKAHNLMNGSSLLRNVQRFFFLPLGKNLNFSLHHSMPSVVFLSSSHRSWFYPLLCYFNFLLYSDPSASEPFLIPLPPLECLPFSILASFSILPSRVTSVLPSPQSYGQFSPQKIHLLVKNFIFSFSVHPLVSRPSNIPKHKRKTGANISNLVKLAQQFHDLFPSLDYFGSVQQSL